MVHVIKEVFIIVKYRVGTINQYSQQLLPEKVKYVERINFTSEKKYPNGCAMVHFIDGQWGNSNEVSNFLKIQIRKDGSEYVVWGGYRLNLDVKNEDVEIVNI